MAGPNKLDALAARLSRLEAEGGPSINADTVFREIVAWLNRLPPPGAPMSAEDEAGLATLQGFIAAERWDRPPIRILRRD